MDPPNCKVTEDRERDAPPDGGALQLRFSCLLDFDGAPDRNVPAAQGLRGYGANKKAAKQQAYEELYYRLAAVFG